MITVATTGDRSAFVIASVPSPDPYLTGERLVVGEARDTSITDSGEAPEWKCWLYPVPGGCTRVGRSVEALTAPTLEALKGKLRKRAERGPWWVADEAAQVMARAGGAA